MIKLYPLTNHPAISKAALAHHIAEELDNVIGVTSFVAGDAVITNADEVMKNTTTASLCALFNCEEQELTDWDISHYEENVEE